MELIETRGRKAKYDFSVMEVGETYQFTATKPDDLKDGVANNKYANRVAARVMHFSRRKGLGWKIARRTFGATVEITILP